MKRSLILGLLVVGVGACSRQKISDQERKREQEVALAENRRAEYQGVTGTYRGQLLSQDNQATQVSLKLEIKDFPVAVEGQATPVLTPKIVGQMRFMVSLIGHESIDAVVTSAEYFAQQKRLNLVVVNDPQISETVLNLTLNGNELSGSWSSAAIGNSGTAALSREVQK